MRIPFPYLLRVPYREICFMLILHAVPILDLLWVSCQNLLWNAYFILRDQNIKKTRQWNLRDAGRITWWVFIFDDDIDPKTNQHPSRLVFNALQLMEREGKKSPTRKMEWTKILFIQSCLSRAHYQIMCASTTKKLLGRVYRRIEWRLSVI